MPLENDFGIHSAEVHEIMSAGPKKLLRVGITVLFTILFLTVIGSYFFKMPEVISTPVKLTTENAPAPLVCKISGKIEKIFVIDGTAVQRNTPIALLESSADYEDIQSIEPLLHQFSKNWSDNVERVSLPDDLSFGELSNHYQNLQKGINEFKRYLAQDFVQKKIEILKLQLKNSEEYINTIETQRTIKEKELQFVTANFQRDTSYYLSKKYGIGRNEYEQIILNFLQFQANHIGYEASIMNMRSSILQLKESLLSLEVQKENEYNQYFSKLDELNKTLINQIGVWKDEHLVVSPIEGKVTFTKYWSENQVVNSGESLATIIPSSNLKILGKAFIGSSALGKVESGQRVNIRLSGYPFMKYGHLEGILIRISLVPEKEGYVADIGIDSMTSTYREKLKFIHEMEGTADIITQDSRFISRFIPSFTSH